MPPRLPKDPSAESVSRQEPAPISLSAGAGGNFLGSDDGWRAGIRSIDLRDLDEPIRPAFSGVNVRERGA